MSIAEQARRTPLEILEALERSPLVRVQMAADPMAAWGLSWMSWLLAGGNENFRRVYLYANVTDDGKERAYGGAFAVDETLYPAIMTGAILSGVITQLDVQAQSALVPLVVLKEVVDWQTVRWDMPRSVKITWQMHQQSGPLWSVIKDSCLAEIVKQQQQSWFPSESYGNIGPVYKRQILSGSNNQFGSMIFVDADKLAKAADFAAAFTFGWWQPAKYKSILNFAPVGTGIGAGLLEFHGGSFFDKTMVLQRHKVAGVDVKDAQRMVYYQQSIVKEMERDPVGYAQAIERLGFLGKKEDEKPKFNKSKTWWESLSWYIKLGIVAGGAYTISKMGSVAIKEKFKKED